MTYPAAFLPDKLMIVSQSNPTGAVSAIQRVDQLECRVSAPVGYTLSHKRAFIHLLDWDPDEECILPCLRLCHWLNLCFFR